MRKKIHNKYRFLTACFIAVAFAGSFSAHKSRAPKRNYSDFHCFYTAGKRILAQENIYVLRDKEAAEFRYTPLFAVLMSSLALIDEGTADTLWYLLNFSLLILSFTLLGRLIITQELGAKKSLILYALTTLAVARFIFYNLDTGQSNILMMSSIITGLYLVSRKKIIAGGAIFAFSVMVKYTPLIFIPYFILRKKVKLSLIIISFILFYLIIPSLFIGFKLNLTYIKDLMPFLTQSTILDQMTILDPKNQSLLSFFHRIFTNCILYFYAPPMPFHFLNLKGAYINFIFALSAAAVYSLALYGRKKNYSNNHENVYNIDYAMLLICVALFNLNAWAHHYILLAMAYFMLIYYLIRVRFKDRGVLILVLSSYLLNMLTIKSIFGKTLAYKLHFYSPFTISAMVLFFALLKIKSSKHKRMCLENQT